jgi:hypothetical protein
MRLQFADRLARLGGSALLKVVDSLAVVMFAAAVVAILVIHGRQLARRWRARRAGRDPGPDQSTIDPV